MINKILSIIIFIVLAYIIPLLGNLKLLLSIQILLIIITSVILFITQPPFSINESKQEKGKDHFSVWVILLACLISQIFSTSEWSYFSEDIQRSKPDILAGIGLLLMVGGTLFRIWAIQTLGKYFTATVQVQGDQKVISKGPYNFIRHPSYLGAYLAIVGSSVLLHAYMGIIVSIVIMFAAYWYRIKVEERSLVKELGDDYRNYQNKTKKLLPFIY